MVIKALISVGDKGRDASSLAALGDGISRAIQPVGCGGDCVGHLGGVERICRNGISAGDQKPLQRQSIVKDICGSGTQVIVCALTQIGTVSGRSRALLFAAVIDKRAIRAALQIEVPAHLFQVSRHRLRSADVGTQRTP